MTVTVDKLYICYRIRTNMANGRRTQIEGTNYRRFPQQMEGPWEVRGKSPIEFEPGR